MMNIQHDYNSENGEFYIEEQGQRIAELSYYRSGANRLLIDHTEVAPRLRGRALRHNWLSRSFTLPGKMV
ncbi:MAG: hypothetical protein HC880_07995 [Bacteroidia bacterium]|nr:hypothetical protein [Bacteroidia bacterium]